MTESSLLQRCLGDNIVLPPEVVGQLKAFAELVEKWNPTVNIVARSTLGDLWLRHIIDSAQVFKYCPADARLWLDIGSGGGFPGIVIAVLAHSLRPGLKVRLVEADQRKAVFLREVNRQLGLTAEVSACRIETLSPQSADVISARALAPLVDLCGLAERHLAPKGVAVFLKGQQHEDEIALARKDWQFELEMAQSQTHSGSAVLVLKGLTHV
jgi:16S rRNA (guanine527-N7)-methyltransferase